MGTRLGRITQIQRGNEAREDHSDPAWGTRLGRITHFSYYIVANSYFGVIRLSGDMIMRCVIRNWFLLDNGTIQAGDDDVLPVDDYEIEKKFEMVRMAHIHTSLFPRPCRVEKTFLLHVAWERG